MRTPFCSHQVLKVSSDGSDRTLLALGEAFTPGSDSNHFCQPTDVAVDTETGNIFVSDGYCNARILKFSADGKYLSEWGAGRTLTQLSKHTQTHTHIHRGYCKKCRKMTTGSQSSRSRGSWTSSIENTSEASCVLDIV